MPKVASLVSICPPGRTTMQW